MRKFILILNEINLLDFNNTQKLQEDLRNIFLKLNDIYHMNINGFYDVKAYKDSTFGIVLELDGTSSLDIYEEGEIDMRIELIEETFLYETSDIVSIPKKYQKKLEIYKNKDTYLLKPKETLTHFEIGELLEYTTLNYHLKNKAILKSENKIG